MQLLLPVKGTYEEAKIVSSLLDLTQTRKVLYFLKHKFYFLYIDKYPLHPPTQLHTTLHLNALSPMQRNTISCVPVCVGNVPGALGSKQRVIALLRLQVTAMSYISVVRDSKLARYILEA